jgi:hypothetical protein
MPRFILILGLGFAALHSWADYVEPTNTTLRVTCECPALADANAEEQIFFPGTPLPVVPQSRPVEIETSIEITDANCFQQEDGKLSMSCIAPLHHALESIKNQCGDSYNHCEVSLETL